MHVLDLFSGIGGFSLGLERAGHRTIAFCEIDPFCRRLLARHWPGIPILDDITTAEFPAADIITGGFPCQDVSVAGKRAGLSGKRSGLYRELVRALRVVRPRHAIVENVAALLGDGMGRVLGDMAESGFDMEWDCIPASALGAPHRRDRVFIVAHADNERCGEAGGFRHRPEQMPAAGTQANDASADADGQQMGIARQPWLDGGRGSDASNPSRDGCGQGRQGRPPDSFARIRIEARWHAANTAGPRLEGWEIPEGSRGSQPIASRSAFWPWPDRWPDEPPLSGVDDGVSHWVDRVRATGNAILPQIAQLIGETLR